MTKEKMLSIFSIAGIEVFESWELMNGYWPRAYEDMIVKNPWWLVRTPFGLVQIGWRKRVIEINWSDTDVRGIVTDDETTKGETMVHAWSDIDAVKYLARLKEMI